MTLGIKNRLLLVTFFLPLALVGASCGGASENDAALSTNEAAPSPSAPTTPEAEQEAEVEVESIEPTPKELTDGEWVATVVTHKFMKEHYSVLENVDDSNQQFQSFFGTLQKSTEEKLNNAANVREIEAINPPDCQWIPLIHGYISESAKQVINRVNINLYLTRLNKDNSFASFESVASKAYFSGDRNFPGVFYMQFGYIFDPNVSSQVFSNLLQNWGVCEDITFLRDDKANNFVVTWQNIEKRDKFQSWLGSDFLILLDSPSDFDQKFWVVRKTGNIIEADTYISRTINLSKILNLSNKRARALAKAQGIEVEDIDIDNLDKYKVTDNTVFPEYKKIESRNTL